MRLGKFSSKVYEESEVSNMNECGVCITDEYDKASHNCVDIEERGKLRDIAQIIDNAARVIRQ